MTHLLLPMFAAALVGADAPPAPGVDAVAGSTPNPAATVDYVQTIKPVLRERCYACHGALDQKGGLRVDTAAAMAAGGDSGPALFARDSNSSLLWLRVSATDDFRMPPEGEPLTASQLAAVRAWIDQGAVGPLNETPEADPRSHWAFQPPTRPPLPRLQPASKDPTLQPADDAAMIRNPIDRFLVAAQQQRGLVAQGPVDRRLWLRRVTLDLIGLPPTAQETADFLADTAPNAYERVVDRLLASPLYGERWGRHWMDIWRYSDWWGLGAEVRNSQKHIWHWRDWIIESLNGDVGYDQMIREMLAADELYPNDLDRLRATGYLARQYFRFNRTSWLDGTIEHTAKAMLGLTFNCGKCHDHKYDPFTQQDYYRFRAIFEPYQLRTDVIPGVTDVTVDGIPRAFDANLEAPTYLHHRGDERQPDTSNPLGPALPTFLVSSPRRPAPVPLPREAFHPEQRPHVVETFQQASEADYAAAVQAERGLAESASELERLAARRAVEAANERRQAVPLRAAADKARADGAAAEVVAAASTVAGRAERRAALADAQANLARAQHALAQAAGDDKKKAEAEKRRADALKSFEAALAALASPDPKHTPLVGAVRTPESNVEPAEAQRRPFPTISSGRRSMLAQWLTERDNPLVARVAVNHLWSRHFGQPLVATVFDFGRKGTPPTHPELLDWLAVELIENHWSMKHLHRLMVTSAAYRKSTASVSVPEATRQADPENRYYWRAQPRRMEAQVVRDSLLALAGDLDLQQGGPSLPVGDERTRRRSLYFVHSHNDHQKFLSMFDDANVLDCYRRAESIVPQQALALENSPLMRQAAERIAARLGTASDEAAFVTAAFREVLATEPTAAERELAAQALAKWRDLAGPNSQAEQRARTHLVQALLNHNDFVTIR